jgi:protein SCO1/2
MLTRNSTSKLVLLILGLLSSFCTIACNNAPNRPATQPAQSTYRYHLKGKVVSVDKQAHMLNVDGEAIPGFMSAMTMPYNVKPESELDKLTPGESITADVVVQGDDSWLENITVTGQSTAPPSK